MGKADFTVEATAFSTAGYDAAAGQVLDVALESSVGVYQWQIEMLVPTSTAGAVVLSPVSGIAAAPSDTMTATLPTPQADGATWLMRSTVNGGKSKNVRGELVTDPDLISERIIAIRTATLGLRKPVFTELLQYDSARGWAKLIEELVDGIEGASAPTQVSITTAAQTLTLNAINKVSVLATTASLPSPIGHTGAVIVKKVNLVGDCTISTPGAETIDGAATYVITGSYGNATFISDGTNWHAFPGA